MPPDERPDDLQRPLDESAPARATQPGPAEAEPTRPSPAEPEPETAGLRPAVPAAPADHAPRSHARPGRWASAVAALRARPALRAAALAPLNWARRGAGSIVAWSRRPTGRFAVPGMLILTFVAAAGAAGGLLVPTLNPVDTAGSTPAPPAPSTAPSALPVPPVDATAGPGTGPDGEVEAGARADALADWAREISTRTDVPVVALQAYGYAELVTLRTTPGCQLTWTTLAAIGRVESNHGSSGGATLLPDGTALPPIIGAPLDGAGGRELIADTDGGALDGDSEFDRAVGPMQFLPSTWRREAVDATGDGVADIHNIHDAALAAANYLCRNRRDLSTPDDWWNAILSYNDVQAYADAVFAAADEYGQRSQT